jgi:hypothetical protein
LRLSLAQTKRAELLLFAWNQGAFWKAAARREIVGQSWPIFSKCLAIPVKIRSRKELALVLR